MIRSNSDKTETSVGGIPDSIAVYWCNPAECGSNVPLRMKFSTKRVVGATHRAM
jgi:hypothetical protein